MKNENIKNEQGRSMVEMLGVLAIIGVLSVMGIAGYKAAMTRHRANELLNEATKRATVVAGQITLRGHSPSLSEFDTNTFSGGTFETIIYGVTGLAAWKNTDQQFTLAITGVDGAVCAQMQETTSPIIKGFSPDSCDTSHLNTVKLTYNNELSEEELDLREDTGVCANENVYLSYNTDPCSTNTPMTGNCKKNSDCVDGEFCNLTGPDWSKPNTGICTSIGGKTSVDVVDLGSVMVSERNDLSWWAAENWCKANHRSLINVEQLKCYRSNSQSQIVGNSTWGYCCAKGKTCYGWQVATADPVNFSSIIIDFAQKLGHENCYWLKSGYYGSGMRYHFVIAPGWIDGGFIETSHGAASGNCSGDGVHALCQ